MEYVGPIWPLNTQGNTWRQTTTAAPFPQPATSYSCYNYKIEPLVCSNPNLKAVWKLDEGSGSVAMDSSSSNNNATITNSPTKLTTGCKFGGCFSLNGTTQYAAVGPALLTFGTGNFTA